MARPLQYHSDEAVNSVGDLVQLCVAHELTPNSTVSAEAIITFGGFSLCRDHFEKVTDLIKASVSMGEIVNDMMRGDLDW